MMEAAGSSETSVNFYQTIRRNNPEDTEKLESDIVAYFSVLCRIQLKTPRNTPKNFSQDIR
jgi:hypothetical protein